jgi:hypothetical protein
MLRGMHPLHIYQILNHYTSRQYLDPGFEKYGAFELLHREAAFLAGLARGQRTAVRDRRIGGRLGLRSVRPSVRALKSYRQSGER